MDEARKQELSRQLDELERQMLKDMGWTEEAVADWENRKLWKPLMEGY